MTLTLFPLVFRPSFFSTPASNAWSFEIKVLLLGHTRLLVISRAFFVKWITSSTPWLLEVIPGFCLLDGDNSVNNVLMNNINALAHIYTTELYWLGVWITASYPSGICNHIIKEVKTLASKWNVSFTFNVVRPKGPYLRFALELKGCCSERKVAAHIHVILCRGVQLWLLTLHDTLSSARAKNKTPGSSHSEANSLSSPAQALHSGRLEDEPVK